MNDKPKKKPKLVTRVHNNKKPVVFGDKTHRNDPCHCGSGKKYKKCCERKDEEKFKITPKDRERNPNYE